MKHFSAIMSLLLCSLLSLANEQPSRIVLISSEASHGWNEHEFPRACQLLESCLERSNLNIDAETIIGWPEQDAMGRFQDVDAIVVFSDGEGSHPAIGNSSFLSQWRNEGKGLAIIHYALEPNDPELNVTLWDSIGGYFDINWSVNPIWEMSNPVFADHVITEGVESFSMMDEWYFHIRLDFPNITPILTAKVPESVLGNNDGPRSGNPSVRNALKQGEPQVLAWCKTNENGSRGFGFTGGHYLTCFNDPHFRKLLLNAIVWTAGVEIPNGGVNSEIQPTVKYKTLTEAIGRGDLQDVERHLSIQPELLDQPVRGRFVPLQLAIMRKNSDIVARLIELGASVDVKSSSGETTLHLAIDRGLQAISRQLIDRGVDLDAKNRKGWTALHLAAAKNQIEVVQWILETEFDPNTLSEAGGTALHEAAVSGSAELIQLLLSAGTDPTIVSGLEVSALDIARQYDNQIAIQILEPLVGD